MQKKKTEIELNVWIRIEIKVEIGILENVEKNAFIS